MSHTPRTCRVEACSLFFLPLEMRVPLKFGTATVSVLSSARVAMTVSDEAGNRVTGWGETPLSVGWVWPSTLDYDSRHEAMKAFCTALAEAWPRLDARGHALEVGHAFQTDLLPDLLTQFNAHQRRGLEPMPHLCALVCTSAFDLALHDAYGRLVDRPVYDTYNSRYLSKDLSHYLEPADGADVSFAGRYPDEFLAAQPPRTLRAWHLVGGLDPLDDSELTGREPADGYPVTLEQWIERDGLKCLKIKLRGTDATWDYDRIVKVGRIAMQGGVDWLTADFNCTVTDPAYVNAILDRLRDEHPRCYGMLLYIEQPFPYELTDHRIDVLSVSARKPLFMDESAHDWQHVRLGRSLGWTGVALKTCKTQTGALLSLCWARAHGMGIMVQDLTNPMLAQIPHVLLAAHGDTIQGVETNGMQFYPEASNAEAEIHPGLYRRRDGIVDLSTLDGPGFGYREEEIARRLPAPAITAQRS